MFMIINQYPFICNFSVSFNIITSSKFDHLSYLEKNCKYSQI
jgi:hypothetical protein